MYIFSYIFKTKIMGPVLYIWCLHNILFTKIQWAQIVMTINIRDVINQLANCSLTHVVSLICVVGPWKLGNWKGICVCTVTEFAIEWAVSYSPSNMVCAKLNGEIGVPILMECFPLQLFCSGKSSSQQHKKNESCPLRSISNFHSWHLPCYTGVIDNNYGCIQFWCATSRFKGSGSGHTCTAYLDN